MLIDLRRDALHGFVHLEIVLSELSRHVLDTIDVVTLVDCRQLSEVCLGLVDEVLLGAYFR
jgi:hypothetical protein